MVIKFGFQRYIVNLGYGVIRDIDFENVRIFVDLVYIYFEEINVNVQQCILYYYVILCERLMEEESDVGYIVMYWY